MKKKLIFLIFFGILAINLVAASSYNLEFNQVGDKVVVKESINGLQNRSYTDSDLLNFAGNEIYFLKKVVFPEDFDKIIIKLNLEKGIVIKNKEIFPLGYEIETDGQTISIVWNLENIMQGENFAIFVNLEDTKKTILSYFFIGFGLIILIAGVWFVMDKIKKTKKIVQKKNRIKRKAKEPEKYDYLLDTEKKIIEELKKSDRNELWQKQIQNSTGFSKAKVSRLIRNLESRGLITKIPFGNTNKVRLK